MSDRDEDVGKAFDDIFGPGYWESTKPWRDEADKREQENRDRLESERTTPGLPAPQGQVPSGQARFVRILFDLRYYELVRAGMLLGLGLQSLEKIPGVTIDQVRDALGPMLAMLNFAVDDVEAANGVPVREIIQQFIAAGNHGFGRRMRYQVDARRLAVGDLNITTPPPAPAPPKPEEPDAAGPSEAEGPE